MINNVYPAIFHPNDDKSFTILFPDLPGCISEGKNLENALFMAQDALELYLSTAKEYGSKIAPASDIKDLQIKDGEFVNLIRAEIKDKRAVKKTISIQYWQDEEIKKDGLSLSRFVQDKLNERYA